MEEKKDICAAIIADADKYAAEATKSAEEYAKTKAAETEKEVSAYAVTQAELAEKGEEYTFRYIKNKEVIPLRVEKMSRIFPFIKYIF